MARTRGTLLGLLLLAGAPTALAVAPTLPPASHREGEVIVEYRPGIGQAAAERFRDRFGLEPRRSLLRGRAELLALPSFTSVEHALEAVRGDPTVLRAEPNFRRSVRAVVPNDPLFSQQWGLRNTGQANFVPGGPAGIAGGDLNLIQAWDADGDGVADRTGIPGVIVAIIDDAIEVSHPDLAPNVIGGHNFVACQNPDDPSPVSSEGAHGTRVAGCALARGNNGQGVAGVAWTASLLPLKFAFDVATHIAALEYARDHGASIINASFGGPGYSQIERDAIAALAADDILYVAAAGNDDSNTDLAELNYPANYDADNIVAVAATNRQDDIASFSQYGPLTTDVAAPGLQIVTTAIGGAYTTNPGTSGTSFASPYAAGVAALLKSHVSPSPGYREIKARLVESGSAVSGANPKQRSAGGRIDADRALELAPGPSLVLKAVAFDDGANAALDPGETLDVVFTVRNAWLDATGVTATLAADAPVTVNSGAQSLGAVAADGEAEARFTIAVDGAVADHRYVTFTLSLAADGGYAATRSYIAEVSALPLGTSVTQSFSGDLYDEFHAWHVDVPAAAGPGKRTLIVRTSTSGADIDLLARRDTPPPYAITIGVDPDTEPGFFCTSGVTASCLDPATLLSGRQDGDEAISVEDPAAGTYHLVVVDFAQQALNYSLEATLADGDLRPDPFDFPDQYNVLRRTNVISAPVTVSGIDTPTFITIVGGEYSITDASGSTAPYTAAEGVIRSGETVHVRVNASGGSASAQVTIGGVTDTFWVNPPPPPASGSGDLACTTGGRGDGGGGSAMGWPLLVLGLLSALLRRRA